MAAATIRRALGAASGVTEVLGEVRFGRRRLHTVTIPVEALGVQIGYFFPDQETALSIAVRNAFDLD